MMKSIVHYYDVAKKAILESSGESKLTFATIEKVSYDQLYELSKLKFIDPKIERPDMQSMVKTLCDET